MQIINKALILLLIVALLPAVSVADDYVPLKTYEEYVERDKWKVLLAARGVDLMHSKMTALGGKYDSSKSEMQRLIRER